MTQTFGVVKGHMLFGSARHRIMVLCYTHSLTIHPKSKILPRWNHMKPLRVSYYRIHPTTKSTSHKAKWQVCVKGQGSSRQIHSSFGIDISFDHAFHSIYLECQVKCLIFEATVSDLGGKVDGVATAFWVDIYIYIYIYRLLKFNPWLVILKRNQMWCSPSKMVTKKKTQSLCTGKLVAIQKFCVFSRLVMGPLAWSWSLLLAPILTWLHTTIPEESYLPIYGQHAPAVVF